MPGPAPDVSLCVITYRRPEGLARLLESAARLKIPEGVRVEIVLVDNDPASAPDDAREDAGIPLRRFRQHSAPNRTGG